MIDLQRSKRKLLWSDDAACRTRDSERLEGAYLRLFGMKFQDVESLVMIDKGDTFEYLMPNKSLVIISCDGNLIYGPIEEVLTC